MNSKRSAVVLGVGPEQGLGAALAKRFAAEGLHVFIAGRSGYKLEKVAQSIHQKSGSSTAVITDGSVERDIIHLFETVKLNGFVVDIAACTVDSNIPMPFLEAEVETFTKLWTQNCLVGFLFGREAVKAMVKQQRGTLFFTGATASLRAKPPFISFAAAKAGLRALAQGMAREFCPQGIHIVHIIIDGVIDGERARRQFPEFVKVRGKDGLLQLEAIADTYWAVHCQHPSAWTHELDLRPYKEPF